MLAAFFLGVLSAALVVSGFQVLDAWMEARRRVQIARWRHRRSVVVGRWPDVAGSD